jgi:hypothetical protein
MLREDVVRVAKLQPDPLKALRNVGVAAELTLQMGTVAGRHAEATRLGNPGKAMPPSLGRPLPAKVRRRPS